MLVACLAKVRYDEKATLIYCMDITKNLEQKKEPFLNQLFDFLRIPSVSGNPEYTEGVERAAQFLAERAKEAGLDGVAVMPTAGNPVVYAEKIVDASKPTVLVYGHYDVQPPEPLELWETPAFEPTVRNGKVYARGACDDKGQLFMHLKALELMLQQGELPCNVKCIFEGEEEVGSTNLETFLEANKEKLAADMALVSDTPMVSNEQPSIIVALRGLSYIEITLTGPNRDLHSGHFGGAVDNPCNALCEMIASLKDADNRITVEGFYDGIQEVTDAERAGYAQTPFDEAYFKSDLDVDALRCEKEYTPFEGTIIRPTLDVNGIWGGYTDEGSKTVLPSKAHAKISMRLVPGQNPDDITKKISAHLERIAPSTMKLEVREHAGCDPCVVPIDTPEYQAAEAAMGRTFGKNPIAMRHGGSIPIVALLQKHLQMQTILMGFGLKEDHVHSPNESYGLWNYYKGIETIPWFYTEYAERKKSKE